ncbi:TetR-like C-terminal domain-containing protein [Microbacterium trichothecenolyticum]|uniref:AcrR family transcriptional regulator n=1 Tax=Microbacterium trichothecenolyticum TaxID=69370 RepID=A0ABU0TX12_MICTR|nr:TetR-like C-terminal domain-containing protein [Microbacterium trichothecenolyticum]MDQ1124186.1 AcrR family transcriptional regulator [Microbacterium trichothecenolyticum]
MSERRIGRPFDPEIQRALLTEAERIMVTSGYAQLSVDGLVRAIGSTRPTFYRRYPNVAHLAFDVIASKFGMGDPPTTGSLLDDLEALQRNEVQMLASDLFRKNLPGLLESIRTDETIRELWGESFVIRRRQNLNIVITAARERGEPIRTDWDLDLIADLLVGPILARALLPGTGALDEAFALHTAHAAFDALTSRP